MRDGALPGLAPTWEPCTPMPHARSALCGATVANRFVVALGGWDRRTGGPPHQLLEVCMLDALADLGGPGTAWAALPPAPAPHSFGAAAVDPRHDNDVKRR